MFQIPPEDEVNKNTPVEPSPSAQRTSSAAKDSESQRVSGPIFVAISDPRHHDNDADESIVDTAARLARRLNTGITLLSVVEVPQDYAAWTSAAGLNPEAERVRLLRVFQQRHDELRSRLQSIPVRSLIRFGQVVPVVQRELEATPNAILAVSTRARSGIRLVFEKSVAFRLIQDAPCPVLMSAASKDTSTDSTSPIGHRILAPLDGSIHAAQSLCVGLNILPSDIERLLVVHVTDRQTVQSESKDSRLVRVQDHVNELSNDGYPVVLDVRAGSSADAIARAAQEHEADLIVIATHGESGWSERMMGSVARRVVGRSNVPMLVIPPAALNRATSLGKGT